MIVHTCYSTKNPGGHNEEEHVHTGLRRLNSRPRYRDTLFSAAPPVSAQVYVEKIVFHSARDGNFEIYMMNPNGSEQTRLTNNPGTDSYPSLAPDGTQIAFESFREGNSDVYVMDIDGANPTRLTFSAAVDGVP